MSNPAVAPSIRAAVFAAVCTLLAVGAHLPMTAAAVPFPAVALGAAAVFAVARAAAARERGLGAITALVGGCQLGLHLVFDFFQRAQGAVAPGSGGPAVADGVRRSAAALASTASMSSMPSMPSMRDPVAALSMDSMSSMSSVDPMSSMASPAAGPLAAHAAPMGLSTGMTLAHVLAALVAAWWLRRGEAAVFAAVRWTGALVRASWLTLARLLAVPAAVVPAPAAIRDRGSVPPSGLRSRLIRFVVIGRGPPAAAAV